MAIFWVGEWDTEQEGSATAGQQHTFVAPRRSTFGNPNPAGQFTTKLIDSDGTKTPDNVFQHDNWWASDANSHLYVCLIDTETDGGNRVKTRFYSGSADGVFPGVQAAQVMVFTGDLTSIRPTPDRPSQWDTYHDPYIFDIPLIGDSWTFTCNREISDGQIVLLAES